jgi:hypothetical protein
MNFLEALKSGQSFKRRKWTSVYWICYNKEFDKFVYDYKRCDLCNLPERDDVHIFIEDYLAEDWEVKQCINKS